MGLFQKKEAAQLPPPRHIAIIMDGNGRWARKRGLPRTAGHAAGAESFRRIANYCRTLGVRYLTVYAFSTENWKRSQEEVSGIMILLGRYLEEALAGTRFSGLPAGLPRRWPMGSRSRISWMRACFPGTCILPGCRTRS